MDHSCLGAASQMACRRTWLPQTRGDLMTGDGLRYSQSHLSLLHLSVDIGKMCSFFSCTITYSSLCFPLTIFEYQVWRRQRLNLGCPTNIRQTAQRGCTPPPTQPNSLRHFVWNYLWSWLLTFETPPQPCTEGSPVLHLYSQFTATYSAGCRWLQCSILYSKLMPKRGVSNGTAASRLIHL